MTSCDVFCFSFCAFDFLLVLMPDSSHLLWVVLIGRMPSLPSSEWADSSLPETRTGCHCLQSTWISRSHVETPRWACASRRTWDQKTGRKIQQVTCTDHPQVQNSCERVTSGTRPWIKQNTQARKNLLKVYILLCWWGGNHKEWQKQSMFGACFTELVELPYSRWMN